MIYDDLQAIKKVVWSNKYFSAAPLGYTEHSEVHSLRLTAAQMAKSRKLGYIFEVTYKYLKCVWCSGWSMQMLMLTLFRRLQVQTLTVACIFKFLPQLIKMSLLLPESLSVRIANDMMPGESIDAMVKAVVLI